jgi:Fe-S-cluster containining protein
VSEARWFAAGLRFRCRGSGNCCSGDPGAVWVNDDEIERLAAHLELERVDFERRYVRTLGVRRSLFERHDGDCVFFEPETRRCAVYAARPVQCRAWPFWQSNIDSREAWARACEACPGAGEGELVSADEVARRAREREAAKRRA